MDLSAAHHHHHHFHPQEMGSDPQSLDIVVACSKAAAAHNPHQQQAAQDKKPRPPDNEPQKCPRCDSTNTKFCYYNNYSLTQPRYFCKSCRRYWTKGGTLRNVPVGGGCRKNNKRSSSSSNSACSSPSSSSSSLLKRPHSQDLMAMATTHHPNTLFSALHLPNSFNSYGGGLGLGFDAMGNATLTDCSDPAVMGGAFLDHQGSGGLFQNLCYGFGGADNSNCVSGISEDMGLVPYDEGGSSTAVTTVKQENRGGLWGLPWQMNGDHGVGGGIEGWNGVMGNSAWHGLLNTPAALM